MSSLIRTAYRAYIWKDLVRYYANRLGTNDSPPKMRWTPMDAEYPDHFTYDEFCVIRKYKMLTDNKSVHMEKVYLDVKDT